MKLWKVFRLITPYLGQDSLLDSINLEVWNLVEILKALIGLELLCRDIWVVYNCNSIAGDFCCSKVCNRATRTRCIMCSTDAIPL